MTKQPKKIILATGGTGGHIFPALALKTALEAAGHKALVVADAKFAKFKNFDEQHIFIPAANFANKSPLAILATLVTLIKGFLKSIWLILNFKPDLLIGFGGYASYPTMVAAVLLRKKIILHEANTVLGKVNKVILPWAEYLTCGFKEIQKIPESQKSKIIFTGNPIRDEIRKTAKKDKNITTGALSILIIGGSQGAKVFSKMIPDALINLPENIKKKLFVYQQAKEEDIPAIKTKYANEHIDNEIKSFFTDMNEKLSKVDLVIARAGASTIAELVAFNIPAIFIPYPSAADDHQFFNAKSIIDLGGGWLVKESKDSHLQILQIIKSIENDKSILTEFSNNLKTLEQDSCANIINLIENKLFS